MYNCILQATLLAIPNLRSGRAQFQCAMSLAQFFVQPWLAIELDKSPAGSHGKVKVSTWYPSFLRNGNGQAVI